MANKLFPDSNFVPCKTFKKVFESVERDETEIGVIPIENSLNGRINEPTNLLINSQLTICAEGMLKIIHCLITRKNVSINDLKQVYAHPEALAQCRNYTSQLNCELISWHDGAAAAEIVMNRDDAGLIASEKVGDIYNLQVLLKAVQDSKENTTRFLGIGKKLSSKTDNDKTSIVFSTKHESGELYHSLKPFEKHGINLTRLESMPIKDKPWKYQFFVDFEGHRYDPNVDMALDELKRIATTVKILGSYPKGELYK